MILLRKIEAFIRNTRWKAYFFLNAIDNTSKEGRDRYRFKTKKHPPHIKEMDRFESELIGMVKNIKFKKIHNDIQQQMSNDIKRVRLHICKI